MSAFQEWRQPFARLWKALRRPGKSGVSFRLYLFVLMLLFLLAVMTGISLILLATGSFSTGIRANRLWMENELFHLSQNISEDFGALAVQGLALSEHVSNGLEMQLGEMGIRPEDLPNHPQQLEELLSSQVDNLTGALMRNTTSGVFLLLDATVNPALEDAAFSRAGVYLKNMEPNVVSKTDPTIRMLRGPASVAREHQMDLLPQWQMEFHTEKETAFSTVMETARETALPLSRLYYWAPRCRLYQDSDDAMLLILPLVSRTGTVMGVCGFEISSMLFKLSYMPDTSVYSRAFCLLAPAEGDNLAISKAMFAGSYSVAGELTGEPLYIHGARQNLYAYRSGDACFDGIHQYVSLYPSGAAFGGEQWMLAIMLPDEDLAQIAVQGNLRLVGLMLLLLCSSILLALLVTRRGISPLMKAIHLVKSEDYSVLPKTNIVEIDDLLEFLAAQDDKLREPPDQSQSVSSDLSVAEAVHPSELLSEEKVVFSSYGTFVKGIQTLSAAERTVFDLYMKGHTAKEIAQLLCLSINTIKTHNRRIYTKLGVTSRKELMLYLQMMQETQNTTQEGHI